MAREILFTSNFNGNLNKDVNTSFVHLATTNQHVQCYLGEKFEIVYKNGINKIIVGEADLKAFFNIPYPMSDAMAYSAWGYNANGVYNSIARIDTTFDKTKDGLRGMVLKWTKKNIIGLPKSHGESEPKESKSTSK